MSVGSATARRCATQLFFNLCLVVSVLYCAMYLLTPFVPWDKVSSWVQAFPASSIGMKVFQNLLTNVENVSHSALWMNLSSRYACFHPLTVPPFIYNNINRIFCLSFSKDLMFASMYALHSSMNSIVFVLSPLKSIGALIFIPLGVESAVTWVWGSVDVASMFLSVKRGALNMMGSWLFDQQMLLRIPCNELTNKDSLVRSLGLQMSELVLMHGYSGFIVISNGCTDSHENQIWKDLFVGGSFRLG